MINDNRFNVLIADDEPRFCEILEDLLAGEDINFFSVHTPEKAVDAVLNYDIHLALLDKRFPTDLEGIQTLRRFKEIKPETEVIMMTAYPDVESNLEAVELGAHSYLPKTMDYEKMHSVLLQLFEVIKNKRKNTSLLIELEERNKWLESISNTIRNWNEKLVRRVKTVENHASMSEMDSNEKFLPPDNVELFAVALVHELNNHLQIIDLILSELTHRENIEKQESMQELQKAVNQLSCIGESYSQIITGQESKKHQPADLELILRYVYQAGRRLAQGRNISVTRDIALSKKKVFCNARLLSDALLNITKNAIEAAATYGDEASAQVFIKAHETDAAIIIEIGNTGAPLEDNFFTNISLGTSQKEGHLGVGLSLASYAIEKHKGKMEMKRKGDWNLLQISLPLAELRKAVF